MSDRLVRVSASSSTTRTCMGTLRTPFEQKRNSHKKHKKAQKGDRNRSRPACWCGYPGRGGRTQDHTSVFFFRVFLCSLWLFLFTSIVPGQLLQGGQQARDVKGLVADRVGALGQHLLDQLI